MICHFLSLVFKKKITPINKSLENFIYNDAQIYKRKKMSKIYNLNADMKVIAKSVVSKRFLIAETLTLRCLPLTMPSARSD